MTDATNGATPENNVIVLFGATGDLAGRKLFPGLFHLFELGLMPEGFRIVGSAHSELSDDEFRSRVRSSIESSDRASPDGDHIEQFVQRLSYAAVTDELEKVVAAVESARKAVNAKLLIHYLSVPPNASRGIIEQLGSTGLSAGARVIMEKPFGTDLASARALNATLHGSFEESQIFRIDHYVGREAVQNILALRFANGMFEPIWNRNHIDQVQIDVPETLSIGMRAAFYEATGAYRDMVVTHLLQVLGFVAMEPPTSFDATDLAAERGKVFDAMALIEPGDAVRGQYDGYRDEAGVAPDSDTETFVAVRVRVDNWRWSGVPFFLRAGKRMAQSRHVLTLVYRRPPRQIFPLDPDYAPESFHSDHLTFELGEPGSIAADFLAKVPGPALRLGEARMSFTYADAFGGPMSLLEPYERLIHDVMLGDRTLFTTSSAIERLWENSAPLLDTPPPVQPYEPGSWGPAAADELIAPRRWNLPDHGA
ncbi:MAG TPA: glucose-6-phosphate dehydrogenase [Solirubrobacteraceae bacterium]|jgi:glucose-6-phosphate 1-dehydrogenase